MRAIQVTEHGGPDVLTLVEREAPEPGPAEVTVDVAAVGVNFADIKRRRGSSSASTSSRSSPASRPRAR
jgi:NADPH2:quinone reductase